MRMQRHITGGQRSTCAALATRLSAWFLVVALTAASRGSAQQHASGANELDDVVAVVNGDPILASDVEREVHIESCSMDGSACHGSVAASLRAQVLQRLIDRDLISQQMRWQQGPALDEDRTSASETALCEGKDGWSRGLQVYGVTPESVHEFCSLQRAELGFIEQRFRGSVRVSHDEVAAYYRDHFVPEYRKTAATPPPLDAIAQNIANLLTEREVTLLLDDWLRVLRAQSQIVILHPMKVHP